MENDKPDYEDIREGVERGKKRAQLEKEAKDAYDSGDMESYLDKKEQLRNL